MSKLDMESHYDFYKKVVQYANVFNGIHSGSIYPNGKIHRWILDEYKPQSIGYSIHLYNDFIPSEKYLQTLENNKHGYRYNNVGCSLIRNPNPDIKAGMKINEERSEDLSIVFTPFDQKSPVKAFDIENEQYVPIVVSLSKLTNINENIDEHYAFPSKLLLPFIDKCDNGSIYIVHFGKVYPSWPNDKPLSSFKLRKFDNKNILEGVYAEATIGRGVDLYGGIISNDVLV